MQIGTNKRRIEELPRKFDRYRKDWWIHSLSVSTLNYQLCIRILNAQNLRG